MACDSGYCVAATTTIFAEMGHQLEEHHQDTRCTTTTLVPPRGMPFERPAIPNEHCPEERTGDDLFYDVRLPRSARMSAPLTSNYEVLKQVSASAGGQFEILKKSSVPLNIARPILRTLRGDGMLPWIT